MRVKVLKSFDYAHDGVAKTELVQDDEAEIRDELIDGLKASGHVGDLDAGAEEDEGVEKAPVEKKPARAPAKPKA